MTTEKAITPKGSTMIGQKNPPQVDDSFIDNTTNAVANDQRTCRETRIKMVKAEERMDLFRELVRKNLGTKLTEGIVAKHNAKIKNKNPEAKPDALVKNLTEDKLVDATKESKKAKVLEKKAEKDLIETHRKHGINQRQCRGIRARIRRETDRTRTRGRTRKRYKT